MRGEVRRSGPRQHLVLSAVLVVRRAAQRAAAFAQAVIAAAAPHAAQNRPFAPVILVDVKPHVPQALRPVAHVNVLKVLREITPLHPKEPVVDHLLFSIISGALY